MVSLELKQEISLPISLKTISTELEPKLSFSDLLKGVSLKKDDDITQTIINSKETSKNTPLAKSTSKDNFLSLLKNNSAENQELLTKAESNDVKTLLDINPKLNPTISVKELKVLIAEAKEYLKFKISDSEGYKKSEIKELPKTLSGLVELAKKFDVDISKITLQDVKNISKDDSPKVKSNDFKSSISTQEIVSKGEKNSNSLQEISSSNSKEKPLETMLKLSGDKKTESIEIPKDIKVQTKQENQEIPKDIKVQTKQANQDIPKDIKVPQKTAIEQAIQIKPQNIVQHTTQQLVDTKQLRTEDKPQKQKTDETLVSLLRGDKESKKSSSLTSEFSVASAKVIAPKVTIPISNPIEKGLESLLSTEQSDSSISSKLDGLTSSKADSFEVKINEAKQMVKYLSQDVKTVIDDYKSPFTRIKLQLNPQQLGEVDLTIVQRGKNLHVNLSSNTTAINTLSANINELRIQLNNSGINNATLNFNNTPQENSSNNGQQQQNRQQEQQNARKEYDYFEKEDTKEEILSSLEIVVPNYA